MDFGKKWIDMDRYGDLYGGQIIGGKSRWLYYH